MMLLWFAAGIAVLIAVYLLTGDRWLPPLRGISPFGADIRKDHGDVECETIPVPSGRTLAVRRLPRKEASWTQAILLHGLCLNGAWYAGLARDLEAEGIRTTLLDLPGHGRSEGPRGVIPGRDELTDDLIEAMSSIAGGFSELPLLLIGHSAGAEFVFTEEIVSGLRKAGANVIGLIGLAPYLAGAGLQARTDFRHPLLAFNPRGLLSERWKAIRYNLPEEWDDPDLQPRYTRSLLGLLAGKESASDRFERLDAPILLVVGTEDRVIRPDVVSDLASNTVCVYQIPGADHMSVVPAAGSIIASTYRHSVAA